MKRKKNGIWPGKKILSFYLLRNWRDTTSDRGSASDILNTIYWDFQVFHGNFQLQILLDVDTEIFQESGRLKNIAFFFNMFKSKQKTKHLFWPGPKSKLLEMERPDSISNAIVFALEKQSSLSAYHILHSQGNRYFLFSLISVTYMQFNGNWK